MGVCFELDADCYHRPSRMRRSTYNPLIGCPPVIAPNYKSLFSLRLGAELRQRAGEEIALILLRFYKLGMSEYLLKSAISGRPIFCGRSLARFRSSARPVFCIGDRLSVWLRPVSEILLR